MSTASASRNITFISKSGTYTSIVMCSAGDLIQYYRKNADGTYTVSPNWATATDKPLLQLAVSNTRAASEGVKCMDANDITVQIDGVEVPFSGGVSQSIDNGPAFGGLLTKYVSDDKLVYGVKVTGNFATFGNTPQSHIIKITATVLNGSQRDTVEGVYSIKVQPMSDDAYKCTIVSPDARNFVIDRKYEPNTNDIYSIKLRAILTLNGVPITSDVTFDWQKNGTNGWESLGSETIDTQNSVVPGDTLIVKETDIHTYGEYRAVATLNKGGSSTTYSDQQGVMDKTDPLDIEPCPLPADETIYEDLSQFAADLTSTDATKKNRAEGKVVYTPRIVTRPVDGSKGTVLANQPKFQFHVKDAAGNYCNIDNNNAARDYHTWQNSFTVDSDMVKGVGDVVLTIISDDIDNPQH